MCFKNTIIQGGYWLEDVPSRTHESKNTQVPQCMLRRAHTHSTLSILLTQECAQWNTLNQHSIISVLGCQRLWERATAHSSGSSVSSAKPMRFIIETGATVASTLWTRGKLSWQWFNCLYLSLKRDFLSLASFSYAHFANGRGHSHGTLSLP